MPDGSGAPVQPKGVAPHSKLSLAKLVELRRRSRIDRARQLASNIETQAQILRATQIYNLEAAQLQLSNQLGSIGQGVPETARVFHETRLDAMSAALAASKRAQTESVPFFGKSWPIARPRALNVRGPRMPVGQTTLDAHVG